MRLNILRFGLEIVPEDTGYPNRDERDTAFIEGVLGFILGLVLWTFGYKIYAGFAFGVFATRNWDLLKSWVKGLLKK